MSTKHLSQHDNCYTAKRMMNRMSDNVESPRRNGANRVGTAKGRIAVGALNMMSGDFSAFHHASRLQLQVVN